MKRYNHVVAVWQFVLDLIPASAAQVAGVTAARMSREQVDRIPFEFSSTKAEQLFVELGALLPAKQSWSSSLRIWGSEETDDVQVWLDGQTVVQVQIRLNAGDLSLPLIGNICALAHRFECLFATSDGAIIQPQREAVVRMIMQSEAMQFVRDPERFLEEAIRLDREGA